MSYCVYEDQYCYYLWKQAGKHSTYGQEFSFLEEMINEKEDKKIMEIIENGSHYFWKEEEFWLLNRLDTPTTGLLYFAKTPQIKKEYKKLQSEGKVEKYYLAQVWWDINYYIKEKGNTINFPIAHHKFSTDRMVVISSDLSLHKIKNSPQEWITEILEREYNHKDKTSTLLIRIKKGIRHQIRSHFSEIGYPIVGDPIYGKKKDPWEKELGLVSIGLKIWEIQNWK